LGEERLWPPEVLPSALGLAVQFTLLNAAAVCNEKIGIHHAGWRIYMVRGNRSCEKPRDPDWPNLRSGSNRGRTLIAPSPNFTFVLLGANVVPRPSCMAWESLEHNSTPRKRPTKPIGSFLRLSCLEFCTPTTPPYGFATKSLIRGYQPTDTIDVQTLMTAKASLWGLER